MISQIGLETNPHPLLSRIIKDNINRLIFPKPFQSCHREWNRHLIFHRHLIDQLWMKIKGPVEVMKYRYPWLYFTVINHHIFVRGFIIL